MLKNNRKLIISDCLSASLSAHFSLSLHLSLQLWLGNRQLRRELLFHHQPRLRIVSITCFIKRYSKSTSPPLLLFPHFCSTGLRCAANFLLVTARRRHRRVCWPRELRNMQTSIREKVCEMHLNATWHSKRRSYRSARAHTHTHSYIYRAECAWENVCVARLGSQQSVLTSDGNDEHLTFTMNMRGTLTHTLIRTLEHALAAAYHGSRSSGA